MKQIWAMVCGAFAVLAVLVDPLFIGCAVVAGFAALDTIVMGARR